MSFKPLNYGYLNDNHDLIMMSYSMLNKYKETFDKQYRLNTKITATQHPKIPDWTGEALIPCIEILSDKNTFINDKLLAKIYNKDGFMAMVFNSEISDSVKKDSYHFCWGRINEMLIVPSIETFINYKRKATILKLNERL